MTITTIIVCWALASLVPVGFIYCASVVSNRGRNRDE